MSGAGGRVVWITGASSGIGRATAARFAGEGAAVALTARDGAALEDLARSIQACGARCLAVPCDVRDDAAVQAAAAEIEGTLGPVEVLVNNAGVTVFKEFLATSIGEFDAILQTNLRGAFSCTRAVLPGMIARGGGLIVMINSVTSRYEFTKSSVYAASKAGLKSLTDVLRKEVRSSGVRLLSLYPGATDTPIWEERVRRKHGDRMIRPEEVARLIVDMAAVPEHLMVEELFVRPIGGDL